mmetsp:Transcript_19923/g.44970  ORF Transcript_19923/g.44970 Transcript_19923/m.44970 type:complete len:103 (-) Transcript_19923:238-546(-)
MMMLCVTFMSRVQLYTEVVRSIARHDLTSFTQPKFSIEEPGGATVFNRSPSSGRSTDGELEGEDVGAVEGLLVGVLDGELLGSDDGLAEGEEVGGVEGASVG